MLKKELSKITTEQMKAFISLLCFSLSILLFIYVFTAEKNRQSIIGCYDCAWDSRQAFLLVIASILLLINKVGSIAIALLASTKVIYSVSQAAFWNNIAEVTALQGNWLIFKKSVKWTYEARPEYFVEISFAIFISSYCVIFLWYFIASKISVRHSNT